MTIWRLLGENADIRDPNNDGRTTDAMMAPTLYTKNTPEGRFPRVGITERSFLDRSSNYLKIHEELGFCQL